MSDDDRNPLDAASIWRHCRTGRYYRVIGVARYAHAAGEASRKFVVYQSQDDGVLWLRDLDDFLGRTQSGAVRFEPVLTEG